MYCMTSHVFELVVQYCSIEFSGCGFCKRLKPDFAAAATSLKGEAVGDMLMENCGTVLRGTDK